jgi:ABC-type branched-subunit amino acid transport system substrate-binding protein
MSVLQNHQYYLVNIQNYKFNFRYCTTIMFPNPQNHYGNNPYIIGNPIGNKEQLFGRETLLTTIKDSLQQNIKFILLHGQRRVGKSSVLRNIHFFVSQDEYVFVHCDFQVHAYSSLGEIFHAIAMDIFQPLDLDTSILQALLNADSITIRRILNNRVLPQIYEKLDNKKLVLLLDEFDVVTQNDTEQAVEFLHLLEDLVRRQEELFVIAVVGRYLDSMPNLVQSFRGGIYQEIGLLDSESTKQLITKPANNILQYKQKAIEEILKFSAGHPYYSQVLCHAIFNLVRCENNFTSPSPTIVSEYDINEVIHNAIDNAEGGLASTWVGLSISEQVVLSVVAEAQERNTPEDSLKVLEVCGLVRTDCLDKAIELLINKGFLNKKTIKIKVELVRLWLLQRHKVRDEIRSLETLEEEKVEQLLSVARSCWVGDKQQDAGLAIYEQVLQLNPNHFSTIVELAERYLEVENFDKALKLYERGYKLDSGRYQQQFLEALNRYGHWLIIKRNYASAKQQYEKNLEIQPGNTLAQERLAEIKAYQANTNIISTSINYLSNLITPNSKLVRLILIGLISGITGSIFLGRYVFSNCTAEQEKSLDGRCITRNIISPPIPQNKPEPNNSITNSMSRGGRTLFTSIVSTIRDRGIDSFKQGNYIQAAQYFEIAVKNNRNDPEILIYYNNALARQNGNPLTLAVVVPAQKRTNSAQEILRGIAQAQNQFNQKNGFQGRLLEIVIADDDNNEGTAKLVAEELVQDKSILGVIGHGSSKVTNTALPIYTKAKLAIVSPTSTSINLQSPVFFRTLPSDKSTAQKLAKYALQNNFKKIVIFCNPPDSYSGSIKEEFRLTFVRNKREEVVNPSCINLATPDFNVAQEVQNLLGDPLVGAIALFPDTDHVQVAIDIAKKCKELMDNLRKSNSNIQQLKLLGGDSLYRPEVANAVEGLVLAVPWFRDAPKSKRFAQEAENQWGGGVSWRTATSFDATQAFIESFKLSPKVSKATVLENLPKINLSSDNNSSGEELKFDSSREIEKEATLIMVKGGLFVNANVKIGNTNKMHLD